MKRTWAGAAILLGLLGNPATATTFPSDAYTKPQTLVRVEGARRLNLYCEGTGRPVILLDAGAGGSSYVWRQVQHPLAATTRVCTYDRAGFGFSDATPHPTDVVHVVADLHRLIRSHAFGGPIIYVGHSIAGLYGLRLAADHLDDVAGEVLVDPTVAGQFQRNTAVLPAAIKDIVIRDTHKYAASLELCLKLARRHRLIVPRTATEKTCVATDDSLDPVLRDSLARQYATPAFQAANLSETRNVLLGYSLSVDDRQVLSAHPVFGTKPVTVLTAGQMQHSAGVTADQAKRIEALVKQAHDDIAGLSQNGRSVMVADSEHFIQIDKPDVVITEINAVVDMVRQQLQ